MLWEQLVNVSGHFASVLKKMLEVSVRNRYQSAPDVLRALEMEPYLESLAKGCLNSVSSSTCKSFTYFQVILELRSRTP